MPPTPYDPWWLVKYVLISAADGVAAGWTFLLTAEDGLATLPFRDPAVDGWARLGVELDAESLESLAVPPREWEDALR